MLIENKDIHAEISSINYEYYYNKNSLIKSNSNLKIIQCIVGNISKIKLVKFGDSKTKFMGLYKRYRHYSILLSL